MLDKPARVFVIDDDPSMRRSLTYLLDSFNYDVETFASAEEFLSRSPYEGVACIVLDVRMRGLSGLDLQDRLSRREHPLPVIFITGHGDLPMGVRAMKKGAVDFLAKPFDDEELVAAVEIALEKAEKAQEKYRMLHELRQRLETLSRREFDVFRHVVSGRLNKETASALKIAEQTVKIHRGRIMKKLRVASLAELVRLAVRCDVPPLEERE